MKSVYVDDTLHRKLKRLAQESQQTLRSLLNRLVQEGIQQMEKKSSVRGRRVATLSACLE